MTNPAGADRPRTEDDLRAAFMLAAHEAPSTQVVLARLRDAERQPARRRGIPVRIWAPIAVAAAVIVAVGVPVALTRHGSSTSSSGAAIAADSGGGAGSKAAESAPSAAASSGGSAVGGPLNSAPGYSVPVPPPDPSAAPSAGHVCTPSEVSLTLTWTQDAGRLSGALSATNHAAAACDLAVKPAVYPLGSDGKRLPVDNVVSAEGYAGPSRLLPGATATSSVTWFGWCGAAASAKAEIDWGTGTATVPVTGPTTPACTSTAPGRNNISSGWFTPLA